MITKQPPVRVEEVHLEELKREREEDYCYTCDDIFLVNKEGEVQCNCLADPYKNNPNKLLNFED